MPKLNILFLFIILHLFLSCNIFKDDEIIINRYTNNLEQKSVKDGWLIMVYMSGTGTLEGESILDITTIKDGFLNSSNPEDLDIVVLHDRGPGYSTADGDWTGTYLYHVTENGLEVVETAGTWRDTADQEESMGSQETLENFLSWAKSEYPRSKEGLIIWNHGGGLSGQTLPTSRAVSWDTEDSGNETIETLYIDEIQQVLETFYGTQARLNLLGFDACYMGMTEIVYEFRDTVEYMVASPAAEVGGWRYEDVILGINNDTTPDKLSEEIVYTYNVFSSSNSYSNTLSAFYVPAIDDLEQKLDNLVIELNNLDKETIIGLREDTEIYYSSEITNDSILYPYIDLGYFVNQLKDIDGLSDSVNEVTSEISNVIKYCFNLLTDVTVENYMGLSIFFPESNDDYAFQWWYTDEDTGTFGNIDFCEDNSWKQLMDFYFLDE